MTNPATRPLVACTRMYNAAPPVTAAWHRLIVDTAILSGIHLNIVPHAFPNDIEDLWKRPDLGIAFMCGRAFMLAEARHTPVAVPLRAGEMGGPNYHTQFFVREDSACLCLEDTFGQRLGWTVHHSHSGYIAVREHLAPYAAIQGSPLYSEEVGPLHTPAMCIAALRENRADVVPLDAYYAELLLRNAPDALAGVRPVAATRSYPMPLLVGSPSLSPETADKLRRGLFEACAKAENRETLDVLCIHGFAKPDTASYAILIDAEQTDDAGYTVRGNIVREPERDHT